MRRIARVLISVAWFAAISLLVSPPSSEAAAETSPQPGPCILWNGVFFCP